MLGKTTQHTLGRRARNLRTLAPILDLEANKRRVGKLDLEPFDLPYLAMVMLDQIITCMGGPGRGAEMSDLYRAVSQPIGAMKVGADRELVEGVADFLVQGLANTDKREAFRDRFFDPYGPDGGSWVDFTFKLIEQIDVTGQENYRWVARTEAINLYFQSLDVDLQSAEIAQAAVIRHFMDQNRWQEAGDAAERAGKLSVGLKNELLTVLENLERNAGDIEYQTDLLPLLSRSRQHLRERIGSEYELVARAEDAVQMADTADRPHIRRLRDFVRMAMEQHHELEHHLTGANDRFVEQQTRQRFRPTATLRFRDPVGEILRPLLAAPASGLEVWFEANSHFFLPPIRRPMGDLVTIAPLLLQDPRTGADTLEVEPTGPTEEFASVEFFTEEEAARVSAFLDLQVAPAELEGLLAGARGAGLTAKERHLLILRLLRFYGELDERGWSANPTGRRLRDSEFYGDNLVFQKTNE